MGITAGAMRALIVYFSFCVFLRISYRVLIIGAGIADIAHAGSNSPVAGAGKVWIDEEGQTGVSTKRINDEQILQRLKTPRLGTIL